MLLCREKYFTLTILAAYKCEIRTEQFYNQSDAKKLLNLVFWIIMGPPGGWYSSFWSGGSKTRDIWHFLSQIWPPRTLRRSADRAWRHAARTGKGGAIRSCVRRGSRSLGIKFETKNFKFRLFFKIFLGFISICLEFWINTPYSSEGRLIFKKMHL